MTTQHTPGPWEVGEGHSYDHGRIVETELFIRRPEDDVAIAADICNPDTGGVDAIARANASILSAAPDLYAALKTMLGKGDFPSYVGGCERGLAALAKAEGREP